MKSYVIELTDELSAVYEDIAKMNHKKIETCLSIILERVICTMLEESLINDKAQINGFGTVRLRLEK